MRIWMGCLLVVLFINMAVDAKTSLTNEPFVHPKLVEAIVSWVSESASQGQDQIVAIDLDGSEDSNRFCCEKADGTYYETLDKDGSIQGGFWYKTVGQTDSGVFVIHTVQLSSGSARWHALLFAVIEEDYGFAYEINADIVGRADLTRPRRLLKKLGDLHMGDRWDGALKVEGNKLYIGKDQRGLQDEVESEDVKSHPDDWETIMDINYVR